MNSALQLGRELAERSRKIVEAVNRFSRDGSVEELILPLTMLKIDTPSFHRLMQKFLKPISCDNPSSIVFLTDESGKFAHAFAIVHEKIIDIRRLDGEFLKWANSELPLLMKEFRWDSVFEMCKRRLLDSQGIEIGMLKIIHPCALEEISKAFERSGEGQFERLIWLLSAVKAIAQNGWVKVYPRMRIFDVMCSAFMYGSLDLDPSQLRELIKIIPHHSMVFALHSADPKWKGVAFKIGFDEPRVEVCDHKLVDECWRSDAQEYANILHRMTGANYVVSMDVDDFIRLLMIRLEDHFQPENAPLISRDALRKMLCEAPEILKRSLRLAPSSRGFIYRKLVGIQISKFLDVLKLAQHVLPAIIGLDNGVLIGVCDHGRIIAAFHIQFESGIPKCIRTVDSKLYGSLEPIGDLSAACESLRELATERYEQWISLCILMTASFIGRVSSSLFRLLTAGNPLELVKLGRKLSREIENVEREIAVRPDFWERIAKMILLGC